MLSEWAKVNEIRTPAQEFTQHPSRSVISQGGDTT